MIGFDEALNIARAYAEKTGRRLTDANEGPDAWFFGNTFGSWMADCGNGVISVDKTTEDVKLIVPATLMRSSRKEDRDLLDKYILAEPDIML